MDDDILKLYHCERCSAVFTASLSKGVFVLCAECGESPVASSRLGASVASIVVEDEDTDDSDELEDLIRSRRRQGKRQVIMSAVLWLSLIALVFVVSYRFKNKRAAGLRSRVLIEAEALRLNLAEAKTKSLRAYDSYMSSEDAYSCSEFLVGGASQVPKIRAYAKNGAVTHPERGGGLMFAHYFDDGRYPRFEGIIKDSVNQLFEVVCWEINDEWKLDWEQHVRNVGVNVREFTAQKELGVSQEFKLYMRRRHTGRGWGSALQVVSYEPSPVSGEKLFELPQAEVSPTSPYFKKLNEKFDELQEKETPKSLIVGRNDQEGLLRVRATLSFVEGEKGEPKLQIDNISAYHWMAFEPVLEVAEQSEQEKSE